MSQEDIQKAAIEAGAALKKILAGKGQLQGNFYFAGDTRGSEAALVVTLLARDPKGEKAASSGKALRKDISGAKFARGTVEIIDGKMTFVLGSGSATVSHIKLGFKKTLSALDGLSLLKKARVKGLGPDDEAEDADESAEATPETPSSAPTTTPDELDIDPLELQKLIADQEAIGSKTESLREFLSQETTEEELGEQIAESLERLARIPPEDLSARDQERRALAELLATGPDPFPAVGEPTSAEISEILSASMAVAVERLGVYLRAVHEQIQQHHARAPQLQDDGKREKMRKRTAELRRAVTTYWEQLQAHLPPT